MGHNLLNAVNSYLQARTPTQRLAALESLIETYHQAQNDPDQPLALPTSDLDRWQRLARQTGHVSVETLLSAIVASPPLLERIAAFLNTPTIDPPGLPDLLIRPVEPISPGIARIGLRPDAVIVLHPEKRDDFRDIVKGMGYHWAETVWRKPMMGWQQAANAAAELGHRLLGEGFWVAPPTPDVQSMIVEESFDPEKRRLVKVAIGGQYDGWLALWWARSEDCYSEAKKISGSRYSKPVVVVPPEFYDEVEDFAALHGFGFTARAREIIDRAKTTISAALLLNIEIKEEPEADAVNGRSQLEIPDTMEIDDDLADND